jgi:sulfite exporter TauE/SafE
MPKDNQTKLALSLLIAFAGIIGFFLVKLYLLQHSISLPLLTSGNANLLAIFFTGLLTGGLTCLAVQGGLLASTIAQRQEERLKQKTKGGHALPILSFLASKLVAYTVLGLFLGWFGSLFQLSLTATVIMQFAVAIFMLGTALNLLQIHPIFRYFVVQPPKFLTRLVRKQSKSNDVLAPAMLGTFTVFIPCGTTQAMMALAIASGSALFGAAILFTFVLGTSPVFFVLGYMATRIGNAFEQRFLKFAALAIILLALYNLDGALALSGSNFTIGNLLSVSASEPAKNEPVTSEQTITIANQGYSPNSFSVKAGSEVTLHLVNSGGTGCTQAFTIPALGIQRVIPVGNSSTLTFTAPEKPTTVAFMCSMGMYRGTINVI